ncbi:hypothetical protein LUZ62_020896 [Rhynchospora pubera]|uniref:DUF3119 family protein n=1 Tax=Rhynchospora pubera TaxID=906938 RepID=A0AAV8GVF3_9POAL|nr:hypothetical protein LUZ62_020896 [Rhynchospora pubera]
MVATLALSSSLLSNPIKGEFHHRTLFGLSSQWRRNQIGNAFSNRKNYHKRIPYGAVASLLGRKPKSVKREIVVPEPDYRLPIAVLGIAGGFAYADNLLAAAPIGLLGLLLLFQTTRVRFVFDDDALEVKVGDQLEESGENVFVGGKNRWKYSTFVNWELWWPQFPILVYFKETQTKPEGQIHFFPVIFNGKQLYDVMVERAGPSKTTSGFFREKRCSSNVYVFVLKIF